MIRCDNVVRKLFCARALIMVLVGMILIAADSRASAQPPSRERGDAEVQPEGSGRGREGGIPRQMVEPSDESRADEGAEEGVPALREQSERGRVQPYIIPPRGEWKLGIYAHNTETGVVVTRVVPGSPAARAGLERGDRIVTVTGFQVGYVGNYLYPLGHELQRQAGPRGEVLLLVQNVRNGRLLVMEVALERSRRDRGIPIPD